MSMLEKMRKSWWPEIVDVKSAESAMEQGFYVALFCAAATAILAAISWPNEPSQRTVSPSALIDALLFFFVAAGILKKSRTAAAGGLGFYLFEKVFAWIEYGGPKNIIVAICFIVAFTNGARGADAYHDFRQSVLHKKNLLALNLVALCYSIVFLAGAFALLIYLDFQGLRPEANDDWLGIIFVGVFLAAYLAALLRVLPFNKKWEVVTYKFSENDAPSAYQVFEEPAEPMWRCVDCDFSVQKDMFSESELFCPKCKGRLE
jgi:hypothetical protein